MSTTGTPTRTGSDFRSEITRTGSDSLGLVRVAFPRDSEIAMKRTTPKVTEPERQRRFVNETELAELTGLSPRTFQKWRLFRMGPRFYKVGSRVLYDPIEVSEWIASRGVGGEPVVPVASRLR
jgi:predicted DNA-binding transcriptional regulator AlpA